MKKLLFVGCLLTVSQVHCSSIPHQDTILRRIADAVVVKPASSNYFKEPILTIDQQNSQSLDEENEEFCEQKTIFWLRSVWDPIRKKVIITFSISSIEDGFDRSE